MMCYPNSQHAPTSVYPESIKVDTDLMGLQHKIMDEKSFIRWLWLKSVLVQGPVWEECTPLQDNFRLQLK